MSRLSRLRYKVPSMRGANVIMADPQRLESKDGLRWATGRNVKVSVGNHRYEGVEVWALKHRVNGKAVTVAQHRDRAEAEAWCAYTLPPEDV